MGSLMAMLAFGKLGFVVVFGYLATRATQRLKDEPEHKPSTLCVNSEHWAQTQK